MKDQLQTIREALERAHDESLDEKHIECRDTLRTQIAALAELEKQEPVAKIVSSGPADFPILQWLSADHSFRAPIGSMLYAAPVAQQPQRCALCNYQHGHQIGCENNPVDIALEARAAQQPQAEAVPLQVFESPRAKALMKAWQEGWDACRDSEYVGEEAQNDAFNQSATVNHCIAEDMLAAPQQAEAAPK